MESKLFSQCYIGESHREMCCCEALLLSYKSEDFGHLANQVSIWLEGDLGAGKTAFARALIHALGYSGRVKSPTYGLLEHYQLPGRQVLHMDLYRIGDPGELEFLGIPDLLDENTILLIEWPERGEGWIPNPDFIFRFAYADQGRDLHWTAFTEMAQACAM